MSVDLLAAEMPQIDHRIDQGFEGVVQRTDALEAQRQAPESISPGEQPRLLVFLPRGLGLTLKWSR